MSLWFCYSPDVSELWYRLSNWMAAVWVSYNTSVSLITWNSPAWRQIRVHGSCCTCFICFGSWEVQRLKQEMWEEMMQLRQVRAALGIMSGGHIICFLVGVLEIQWVYFDVYLSIHPLLICSLLNICEALGFSDDGNTDRKSILQAAEQNASGVQCTSLAARHETPVVLNTCLAALETEVSEH